MRRFTSSEDDGVGDHASQKLAQTAAVEAAKAKTPARKKAKTTAHTPEVDAVGAATGEGKEKSLELGRRLWSKRPAPGPSKVTTLTSCGGTTGFTDLTQDSDDSDSSLLSLWISRAQLPWSTRARAQSSTVATVAATT